MIFVLTGRRKAQKSAARLKAQSLHKNLRSRMSQMIFEFFIFLFLLQIAAMLSD